MLSLVFLLGSGSILFLLLADFLGLRARYDELVQSLEEALRAQRVRVTRRGRRGEPREGATDDDVRLSVSRDGANESDRAPVTTATFALREADFRLTRAAVSSGVARAFTDDVLFDAAFAVHPDALPVGQAAGAGVVPGALRVAAVRELLLGSGVRSLVVRGGVATLVVFGSDAPGFACAVRVARALRAPTAAVALAEPPRAPLARAPMRLVALAVLPSAIVPLLALRTVTSVAAWTDEGLALGATSTLVGLAALVVVARVIATRALRGVARALPYVRAGSGGSLRSGPWRRLAAPVRLRPRPSGASMWSRPAAPSRAMR